MSVTKMKYLFALLSAAFIIPLIAACGGDEPTPTATRAAPASTSTPTPTVVPILITSTQFESAAQNVTISVAIDRGFFANQGLDVTVQSIGSGGGTALRVLTTGESPFGNFSILSTLGAIEAGEDLVIIGQPALHSIGGWFAQGDSTINGLQGATIAATRPGSSTELSVKLWANQEGLTQGEDFELIYAGGVREGLVLLQEGKTDMAIVPNLPPFTGRIAAGEFRAVKMWRDIPGMIPHLTVAKREYVEQNPEVISAWWRALNDAQQWMFDNFDSEVFVDIFINHHTPTEEVRDQVHTLIQNEMKPDFMDIWDNEAPYFNVDRENLRLLALEGVASGALDEMPNFDEIIDERQLPR